MNRVEYRVDSAPFGVWTKMAWQSLGTDDAVHVELNAADRLLVTGACPRCAGPISFRDPDAAWVVVDGGGMPGERDLLPTSRRKVARAVVACQNPAPFEHRPEGALGCGAVFAVWVLPEGSTEFADPGEPPQPPTRDEAQRLLDWLALVRLGEREVAASGPAWREGLASLAATGAAGVALLGIPAWDGLQDVVRIWAVVILTLGVIVGGVASWLTLVATAGRPALMSRVAFGSQFDGSVERFLRSRADAAARRFVAARWLTVAAAVLTLAAVVFVQLAPPPAPEPAALVQVDTAQGPLCGELVSADGRRLRVQVEGESAPRTVAFGDVANLRVVAECP